MALVSDVAAGVVLPVTPQARLAAALDRLAPFVEQRALEVRLGLSRGMLGMRLPTTKNPRPPGKELLGWIETLAQIADDYPHWLRRWLDVRR